MTLCAINWVTTKKRISKKVLKIVLFYFSKYQQHPIIFKSDEFISKCKKYCKYKALLQISDKNLT